MSSYVYYWSKPVMDFSMQKEKWNNNINVIAKGNNFWYMLFSSTVFHSGA